MFFYSLFNFFIILYLFIISIYVYKKYKNYSGIYFLLSILFLCIWLFLNQIIYGFIKDKDILIYIFRFMYSLSFLGLYFMLLFVYFFQKHINKIHKILILFIIILIFIIFTFTPYIISDLTLIKEKNYYFENYGEYYILILIIYILFIPLFLIISFIKLKTLRYINKARLFSIIIGYSISMFLLLIFYLILPILGVFIFENILLVFLIPLLYSILYSINVYNFSNLKLRLGKIFIYIISIILSILSIIFLFKILENYLFNIGEKINIYLIIIISVIINNIYNNYLNKYFLGNNSIISFEKEINKLKKNISFIFTINKLNHFLDKSFYNLFKISNVNIKIFNKKSTRLEIYKYFSKNIINNIFINDIVFLEENKHKFNIRKIKKEINNNIYLIFPLFNNKNKLIGIFQVGGKLFKDYFSIEEIKILKDFVDFLIGHLKYIEMYSRINNLNINLDKIIDEKTIKYNNLINKQKEFISMSSHEIKTPIMGASFQIENIIDDIELGEYNNKSLKKDLYLLKNQIFKVSDLVNNIFTIQKYNIKKNFLYIEYINLKNIFILEINILKKTYPNIKVILDYDNSIGFINIDKIQFTQVISNLLNNSIKFINNKNGIIKISVKKELKGIFIIIEDNGKGLGIIKKEDIFKKYKTGDSKYFGLGMGLYLCHKIIKLHGGNIEASNSSELKGAQFTIFLPK